MHGLLGPPSRRNKATLSEKKVHRNGSEGQYCILTGLHEHGTIILAFTQVRKAGWLVSNGMMTVDEAVAAFGKIE